MTSSTDIVYAFSDEPEWSTYEFAVFHEGNSREELLSEIQKEYSKAILDEVARVPSPATVESMDVATREYRHKLIRDLTIKLQQGSIMIPKELPRTTRSVYAYLLIGGQTLKVSMPLRVYLGFRKICRGERDLTEEQLQEEDKDWEQTVKLSSFLGSLSRMYIRLAREDEIPENDTDDYQIYDDAFAGVRVTMDLILSLAFEFHGTAYSIPV